MSVTPRSIVAAGVPHLGTTVLQVVIPTEEGMAKVERMADRVVSEEVVRKVDHICFTRILHAVCVAKQ